MGAFGKFNVEFNIYIYIYLCVYINCVLMTCLKLLEIIRT